MTLIQEPSAIFITLVGILGFVFYVSSLKSLKKFFNIVPSILFIYFIPTLLSTLKILPTESPFYSWAKKFLVPAALLLLLMTIDIPAILKLGGKLVFVTVAGALGVVIGGPIVIFLFGQWLPPDTWRAFTALAGAWIGGTGNFAALSASLDVPQSVLAPTIVIDTFFCYLWMAFLMFCSPFQDRFNRWNRADVTAIDDVKKKLASYQEEVSRPTSLKDLVYILTLGFVGGYLCMQAGGYLPESGKLVTHTLWGVMIVTAVGIALSFTRLRKFEGAGASKIGNAVLFLVLTTMGAQGDLRAVAEFPVFFAAGFVWVLVHGTVTLIATRLVRAPLFFATVASQANLGGTISAPIVAELYQPHMAPAGLLMALVGTLLGNYGGLLSGFLMQWVGG